MKKKKLLILIFIIVVLSILCFVFMLEQTKTPKKPSDLVCVRTSNYITFIEREKAIIKFDENSIITEYENISEIEYNTQEEAINYYNEIKEYVKDDNTKLVDKTIITSKYFNSDEIKNFSLKTKQEMKNIFEGEFSYECK